MARSGQKNANNSKQYLANQAKRRHSVPRRSKAMIRPNCFLLAGSSPDRPKSHITGRYQDKLGVFTLNINQAGTHIECFLAFTVTAKDQGHKPLYRLQGEEESDGKFTLHKIDEPSATFGTIWKGTSGSLMMIIEDSPDDVMELLLNSSVPFLSPGAIEQIPEGRDIIQAYEWYPLTRQYISWLKNRLSAKYIEPLLREYMEATSSGSTVGDQHQRGVAAKAIDDHIGKVLSTAPPNGWHPDDLPLAQFYARCLLSGRKWIYKDMQRSYLGWMQVIMDRATTDRYGEAWGKLDSMREHLMLKGKKGQGGRLRHKYEAVITATGLAGDVGVGLGGFFGGLDFKRTTSPKWHHQYFIWFAGVSGGLSVGFELGKLVKANAEAEEDWLPQEIPGPFTVLDAGAKGSVGAGAGIGATSIVIKGRGIHSPLIMDTNLVSGSAGLGAGAELGISWGYIHATNKRLEKVDISKVIVDNDYALENRLKGRIHFRLDCSLLSKEAMRALRVFCAMELASLTSPGSSLVVKGHADRSGRPRYNDKLSEYRARNTMTSISDILGAHLTIPKKDEQRRVFGVGEREAEKTGERDGKVNVAWRKVEIILNSRKVLTLTAG